MAGETNTDRINRLGISTATLFVHMDNLRDSVERLNTIATDLDRRLHDFDKQLAHLAQKVDRFELQLDKLDSRRWELWKLVLVAFLGGILTLATTVVSGSLSRLIGDGPSQTLDRTRPRQQPIRRNRGHQCHIGTVY